MSLEPPTTAKVTLNTTKGPIKIDIFAKELPSTSSAFIKLCHFNKFKDTLIQVNRQYISFSSLTKDNNDLIPKESHSRIRCKQRGYVAYSNGQWVISRSELSGVDQVFGKIDQESSWYIVNEVANGEVDKDTGELVFPVTIVNSIVDVPYFKLELGKEDGVGKGDEDERLKVKKPRVVIDYRDDDDEEKEEEEEKSAIQIKSAYDTRKRKGTKVKSESKVDASIESNLETVDQQEREGLNDQRDINEKDEGEDNNSKSSSENDSDSDSDSDSDFDSENDEENRRHPLKRDPTIDPPFNPNLDLSNAESITYSELKSHKFIINT